MADNNVVRLRMNDTPVRRAWRGVKGCKNYSTPVPISQAVAECGADYSVRKDTLVRLSDDAIRAIKEGTDYTQFLDLKPKDIITSHMATVRDDNDITLGVVGSGYGVVQNAKAFEFIDIITSGRLGGDAPIIETAGVLGVGERMYVTARMPHNIQIGGNNKDVVEDYILFTNTHDGSGAVTVLFTPIRVVCENTLNMALRECKNKLIFKHTSKVNERLDFSDEENLKKAKQVLGLHGLYKQNVEAYLNNLAQQSFTDAQIKETVANVFLNDAQMKLLKMANMNIDSVEEISTRAKNQIQDLRDTIENGVGQEYWRGTKLWVYNGFTSFYNNNKTYKNGAEERFNSLIDGDAHKKCQKAFDLLIAA